MMQQFWKQNIKWDEILPENAKESWINWLNELSHLKIVKIPRPYFKDKVNDIQFHVMSSSLSHSTSLMSKSKVAPVKQQTIPRLELLAAHLGAELTNHLSTTVLA